MKKLFIHKKGSLVVLQTAFLAAIQHISDKSDQITREKISKIISFFELGVADLYKKNQKSLEELIQIYGDCLKSKGNVRYLANNNFGVLALIDSSECPP